MKTQFVNNLKGVLLFFLAIFFLASAGAQNKESKKKAVLKKSIVSKYYVFKAQNVMPMRGITRQLTSEYDLKVSGDSVVAYLPYFGRAYSAPIGGSEGGIQFTSTHFGYTSQEKKKGGWDISITPSDTKDVRQLSLFVSAAGYATLQVSSTNRDPISFSGYVVDPANKKSNK